MIVMIPEKGKPILWEEMSWTEVEELVKTMDMVILPTAATEQHGPHLPLAVDTIDCYEVAKRISARLGIPDLPPILGGLIGGCAVYPAIAYAIGYASKGKLTAKGIGAERSGT
jgi:creatinine amidohydrolase/Fe(II)-dependent formamide hydrolase-like protein